MIRFFAKAMFRAAFWTMKWAYRDCRTMWWKKTVGRGALHFELSERKDDET